MSTTVKTSKSAAQVHRLRLHARTSMTNQLEGIIDLRGWLALIDGFGELRHIDGAPAAVNCSTSPCVSSIRGMSARRGCSPRRCLRRPT